MKTITLLLIFLLVSCGYNNTKLPVGLNDNNGQGGTVPPGATEDLTFKSVKSQFFEPQCLNCHSNAGGNKGGINLETYINVSRNLSRIQSAVNGGFMPPAGPVPTSSKDILNQWIAAGAPEVASSNPSTGTNPPPTSPINPNPGDQATCDDDLTGDDCDCGDRYDNSSLSQPSDQNGRYRIIGRGIYFDVTEQNFIQIRKHGDDDCDQINQLGEKQ